MVTSTASVVVRMDNPPEFSETEDGKRYIVEGGTGNVLANSDGTTEGTTDCPRPRAGHGRGNDSVVDLQTERDRFELVRNHKRHC